MLNLYGRSPILFSSIVILCSFHASVSRSQSIAQGAGSSGGGYYQNSKVLLADSAKKLAAEIRSATISVVATNCHRHIYSDPCIPYAGNSQWSAQGWTNEKMAQVIENVRMEPNTPSTPRPGSDEPLLLNYGIDAKGPYLKAQHDFFPIYENVPVSEFYKKYGYLALDRKEEALERDIQIKLLHEFSHLLGEGNSGNNDDESDQFAFDMAKRLSACQYVLHGNSFELAPTSGMKDFNDQDWEEFPAAKSAQEVKLLMRSNSHVFYHKDDDRLGLNLKKIKLKIEGDTTSYFFNIDDSYSPYPFHPSESNTVQYTSDGMVSNSASGHFKNIFMKVDQVSHGGKFTSSWTSNEMLITKTVLTNECGDISHQYDLYTSDKFEKSVVPHQEQ